MRTMPLPRRAPGPSVVAALLLAALPAAAADAPAVTHYVLDPAKSTLEFAFAQAGAQNKGQFKRFTVTLDFSADNLAASHLDVTIDMNSLDTGDQERDQTLRDSDLFAVKKFAQARFSAAHCVAFALHAGYLGLDSFGGPAVNDPNCAIVTAISSLIQALKSRTLPLSADRKSVV